MRASVERVRASLPENQRARFDTALQIIAFKDVSLGSLFREAAAPGSSRIVAGVKEFLNGKTGAQVIAGADSIMRARTQEEIKELDDRRVVAERARTELAKFVVLQSRFHVKKTDFIQFQIVDVSVRNGTTHAVSRVYFVGTLTSPGRSVPWVKDDFSYHVAGGIEPGERASWTIYVNEFSGWANPDIPRDAVLKLDVVRLNGANDETLYSAQGFSAEDQAKLDSLRARLK